jgi:hypothetical protein
MASIKDITPEQCPDNPVTDPKCYVCEEILKHLAESNDNMLMYTDIGLGTLDEVERSPCQAHKSLVRSLQKSLDKSTHGTKALPANPPFGAWRSSDTLELVRVKSESGARITRLVVHRESTDQRQEHDLVLVKNPASANHHGAAVLPNRDWVDLYRCRDWLKSCLNGHGHDCENPMNVIRRPPRLLIDTKRRCIVTGSPEHKYFALSYRIGRKGVFILNPLKLIELRRENALRTSKILSSLQLTVQHAISLADALDAEYLWIDVLCVVHGGEVSLAEQLQDMASIYSSAVVTMVVADGDGWDGIPGLHGISPSRNLRQPVFRFRDERFLLRPSDFLANGGDYHQRAWTHQEFKMSPRKLIFRFGQVHWVCSKCRCYEWLARSEPLKAFLPLPRHILLDGVPDLANLFRPVLAEYNRKVLGFPQDALSAVLGLLAVFSRTFTGGFLYGLPEILFDAALGWDPVLLTKRRTSSKEAGHVKLGPSELPSWSWIGWEGPFAMLSTEPHEIASKQKPNPRRRGTSPLSEWFTSDDPDDPSPRRIWSTWLRDRDSFVDNRQPLLEGWSRHEDAATNGSNAFVYEHHRLLHSDGTRRRWKHPFPVPVIDASTPFTSPTQTRYLFCKTWKTSAWVHRSTDPRRDFGSHSPSNILVIREDVHGPMIGKLFVSEIEAWSEQLAHRVDVVAISKITDSGKGPERKMIKVLWVKWENGIAYRHGSGELDEDAWHKMEVEGKLEKIDLILG